ncbi:uncharacterized protein V1513DRAFT_439428 [Lipomyces chichibuensis]|uniref:uncharacterized protein n=1 Tax=Lipomyces chichibuensis TaxID=1546026 RepID=UPI003343E0BC
MAAAATEAPISPSETEGGTAADGLSPVGTVTTSKFPPTLASVTFPAPPTLPKIIVTKDDIKNNVAAYETLLSAAAALRTALAAVAQAENQFGTALETCAKCRGASESEDGLSGAAGLHYLAANHHKILSESFTKGFEQPVQAEVDTYAKLTKEHEDKFQKETISRTKQLRKTEKQHVKLGKKKQRNLALYRSALMDLTAQVDGLEKLKYEYFKYSLDITQDISAKILKQATSIVRAEVEIFEGIARKGWTGEGLDDILSNSTDPFAVEEKEEAPENVAVLPHDEPIIPPAPDGAVLELVTPVDGDKDECEAPGEESADGPSDNAESVDIEKANGEIEEPAIASEESKLEEEVKQEDGQDCQDEQESTHPPNVEGSPEDWAREREGNQE